MKFVIPCLVSFLFTALLTPLVIRCATACNCLDIPGERRLHGKVTPRWGGLAFFAGVLPFLWLENGTGALTPFLGLRFIPTNSHDIATPDFTWKGGIIALDG